MDNSMLLSTVGGLIITVFVIIAIVIRLKSNTNGEKSAKLFLEGLSDTFYNKIVDIITNIDIDSYTCIEEFQASVLNDIYDSTWDYVEAQLAESSESDIVSTMMRKVLNREFVSKFVDNIIDTYQIQDKLDSMWKNKSEEKKDENLQEEFEDSEKYIENLSNDELEPAKEIQPTEEELAALNPPSDEEKEYNPEEDNSVEIIEDDVFIDGNGRKRSKSTGRFV